MAEARRARLRTRLGAVVVLVLVALGCAVLVGALRQGGQTSEVVAPVPTAAESAAPAGGVVYVHVLGAVERSGLYELAAGSRVVDAVAAAGGFRDDADQAQLNLARPVSDGEQLKVFVVGEAPAEPPPGEGGVSSDGLIDLNAADAAALDTLPRIGPALAKRIIAWRDENGPFVSVDDLGQVSGIGEKTLEQLRDLVRV